MNRLDDIAAPSRTALVVEVDPGLRRLFVRILTREGLDATGVADAAAALVSLAASSFSLILTDVNMPLMSGAEMVRHLRDRGDRTPVILVSGLSHRESEALAVGLDISAFLQKPVDMAALTTAVQRVLLHQRHPAVTTT